MFIMTKILPLTNVIFFIIFILWYLLVQSGLSAVYTIIFYRIKLTRPISNQLVFLRPSSFKDAVLDSYEGTKPPEMMDCSFKSFFWLFFF